MKREYRKIIASFHKDLSYCREINDYILLANKYDHYENPYPYYFLALVISNLGYKKDALNLYLKAISLGLEYPNKFWDTQLTDSIGSSISHLICDYKFSNSIFELKKSLYVLGFAYLSNCINIMGLKAVDSYFNRGLLNSNNDKALIEITHKYLNIGLHNQVMAISDFYKASIGYRKNGYKEEANNALQNAIIKHEWLEDISVSGKDADEYTIENIAKIGSQRNDILSSALIDEFKSKNIQVTSAQLQNEIHSHISL